MSIVRVGMSESKGYGDGYDAIFGGKKKAKPATAAAPAAAAAAPKAVAAKKPAAKKPAKKK